MNAPTEPRHQIRQFLARNFLLSDEEFPFDDGSSLIGEGVVDSTGVLELIQFLEGTFGIAIADAEAVPQNLDSVRQILDFLGRKLPVRRVS